MAGDLPAPPTCCHPESRYCTRRVNRPRPQRSWQLGISRSTPTRSPEQSWRATGPSWAAVASCHGRGDTTRGGGGWEATAPHRDGASTQVRYHGWYGLPERGADSWEECPDGGSWGAAGPRRRRRWPRRNGAGQGLDYQYG